MNTTAYHHGAHGRSGAKVGFVPVPYGPDLDDIDPISSWPGNSLTEFYAHALMASAQAAAACDELCELLEIQGEQATAALFRQMSLTEAARTSDLVRKVACRPLPQLPYWHYNWFYSAQPDQGARELVAHLMTPRVALGIAMDAGCRVMALYERLSSSADDAEVRAQAGILAAEKARLLEGVANALAAARDRFAWQDDFIGLWPMP